MSIDDQGAAGRSERDVDVDSEHDAHLQAALRHAPDAAIAAPTSLREAILLQARLAAKASPSSAPASPQPARRSWWAALDRATSWLARPAVAAGFAGVTAATLIGLMWWDRPIDAVVASSSTTSVPPGTDAFTQADRAAPQTATPAEPGAAVVAPSPPTRPADAGPPSTPSTPSTPSRRAIADQAVNVAPSPPMDATALARSASPGSPPRAAAPRADAGPAAADVALADAQERRDALQKPNAESMTDRAVAAQGKTDKLAEPLAEAAPSTTTTALATRAVPTAAPAPAMAKAKEAPPTALARAAAMSAPAPTAAGDAVSEARARANATSTPLAAVRASIADEPARWRWRRSDGAAEAMSEPVVRWIAAFDSAGAWMRGDDAQGLDRARLRAVEMDSKPAAAPSAFRDEPAARASTAAMPADKAMSIELLRDGRVQATLRIEPDGSLSVVSPDAPAARSRSTPASGVLGELRVRAPPPTR